MHRANLSDPEITYDDADPDGFRSGMFRLGTRFGARQTGTSLYEIPPGQALCPYHYEYGEEEWLLVLSGTPSVRTPDGTECLAPSDVVFFPTGPEGAHQVLNETDEPTRVLMWSTIVTPTATAYPDSDKIGIWTGDKAQDVMAPRSANVDYYHGESREPPARP
ncbi:MAG TPA: cupin domain-containing protein [Solirubrobacteraceae bacterium]|nr:cupin domain-containing protein [Solirubrobacteraceae bacterium]